MIYKVVHDPDPSNPRKEFDQLGTMLYSSSRYLLGDEQVEADRIKEVMEDDSMIGLWVYAYIHSGIVLNTSPFSCPWDSGKSGCIFVSKEKVLKEWNRKRMSPKLLKQVLSCLEAEVKVFSAYLSGEVYGWQIEDEEGNHLDSCYGYYSYQDAEDDAKVHLANLQKEAA